MIDTHTFYDRISGAYDLIADAGESACRQRGVEMLDPKPGERVLEVGFGTGHALVVLADAVRPTGHVCGLELSSGMLEVAHQRIAGADERNVGLVLGDARTLCFRDAAFDAAFMSFTLELFEGPAMLDVLMEVRRVLRPGGRLGVVAMAMSKNAGTLVGIYEWLHRHFPLFVDCRPIDLPKVLEQHRFLVIRKDALSIWTLPIAVAVCVTL